jgi:hypothetical protein
MSKEMSELLEKYNQFYKKKLNEGIDEYEKEVINGQIDYAIKILRQLVNPIKSFNLSTEEYNSILFKKIKELEKEKFERK